MSKVSGRTSGDGGESLVELLIALALLGLAVVAVVSGLGTSVVLSDVHRKESTAGAEVRSFAEKVENLVAAGSGGYVACAGTGTYNIGSYSDPAGYTRDVAAVRYWDGTSWSSTCATDVGLQKLTLRVRSSDLRATELLDVVVRKPCGPGQPCA